MVGEIVHAVDPEGDVVLVLRNPNAPFAVWEDHAWAGYNWPVLIKKRKKKKIKKEKKCTENKDSEFSLEPEPAPTCQDISVDQETKIKFLLSSRHLILASCYFKTKLNGAWKETTPHAIDSRYHLEASDWDPDALLILMHVIHGRMRSVPRRIDCEMLAKIAVLVDYYDCHEVVEVFASIWIDALNAQLPSQCNRDLVLWLTIAHVFQREDVFAKITKTAVLKGQGPMPTMDLPIPPIVIDLINWRRQDAVRFILDVLDNLRLSLRKGSEMRDLAWSCMHLGALDKSMYEKGLLGLSEPCLGHGVIDLETIVHRFRIPFWNPRGSSYHLNSNGCELSQLIKVRLGSEFEKNKEGFSLTEAAISDFSRREG